LKKGDGGVGEELDFERAWLGKLSTHLDEIAGEQIRKQVLQGSEALTSESPRATVLDWTRGAMERLDSLVEEAGRRSILAGCACQYPVDALQEMRKAYEETGDISLAHDMLQAQFESFLRDTLHAGPPAEASGMGLLAGGGWKCDLQLPDGGIGHAGLASLVSFVGSGPQRSCSLMKWDASRFP